MDDLRQGMHPGIGSAGTDHPDIPVGNPAQGRLDLGLYRTPTLLPLPARIGLAIIFNTQGNAHDRESILNVPAFLVKNSVAKRPDRGCPVNGVNFAFWFD
jgi:hypothetical protein